MLVMAELESLGFRYAGAERTVIGGLDLVIPACGSVAFVGPTSVGESTLADLIADPPEPTSGRVLADGVAPGPETRRRRHSTFPTNGSTTMPWSARRAWRIRTSSSQAGASVGERGVRLSGSRRQRVGSARAGT